MAQRQTVTVLAVEERRSNSGKAYWRVRTDSGVYFVWDQAVAAQLQPETTAVVSINGTTDYPRIVAVHEAPQPIGETPAEPGTPPAASDRQRQMLKMSALRTTGEILHGSALPADQVIAYAEQLLSWLEW